MEGWFAPLVPACTKAVVTTPTRSVGQSAAACVLALVEAIGKLMSIAPLTITLRQRHDDKYFRIEGSVLMLLS
jgi:hypothetical protein